MLIVLVVVLAVAVLAAVLAAGAGGWGGPTVVRRTIIRRPVRRVYDEPPV